MNIAQTIASLKLFAAVAGTQATTPDSRKADDWIKDYLDKKQERLNNLRMQLDALLNHRQERTGGPGAKEVNASWQVYKDTLNQDPSLIGKGQWAVMDRDGLILSVWETKEEAEAASFPVYNGIAPSGTGPTAGTLVKKIEAEEIFVNPQHGDQTRRKFLKHDKPKVVKLADWLRMGDHRPSSAGGAAGSGGTAGPGGGGGGGF